MVSTGMVPGVNSQLCLEMFRNGFPRHGVSELEDSVCLDMFRKGFHRHATVGALKICLDMYRKGFHKHVTGGALEHTS